MEVELKTDISERSVQRPAKFVILHTFLEVCMYIHNIPLKLSVHRISKFSFIATSSDESQVE